MKAFEKEVKEKWGHTQAYKEYEEKHHSKQAQEALTAELDCMMAEFARCMNEGQTPESTQAQSLVKALQDHITEHYYHCTDTILAGLGQMYVADERFKNNIDKHGDGTANFISEAIALYVHQ